MRCKLTILPGGPSQPPDPRPSNLYRTNYQSIPSLCTLAQLRSRKSGFFQRLFFGAYAKCLLSFPPYVPSQIYTPKPPPSPSFVLSFALFQELREFFGAFFALPYQQWSEFLSLGLLEPLERLVFGLGDPPFFSLYPPPKPPNNGLYS
jgi:hypothetical protein